MIPTLLRRSMSGILVFVVSATAASPHHSFPAVYDDKRAVTVSGVRPQAATRRKQRASRCP